MRRAVAASLAARREGRPLRRRARSVRWAVTLALLVAGCSTGLGNDPGSDGGGGRDGASDAAGEGGASDATVVDAALDTAAIDAALDGASDGALDGASDAPLLLDGSASDLTNSDALPCRGGFNATDPQSCPLACSPLVTPVADEGRNHQPFGTHITYQHNPPASGDHWPAPAPWGRHDEVVPREWWVHNLEHGGVVFLYNCPGDGGVYDADAGTGVPNQCPDVIAALAQLMAAYPQDNWYDQLFETRVLITPDPLLPGKVGAVAWDWAYVADSLDTAALDCFLHARYGRGPEVAP